MNAEGARPLSLLLRIGNERGGLAALPRPGRERWWTETLGGALAACAGHGRLVGIWRSTWASDWHYFAAYEFPSLDGLEAGVAELGTSGAFGEVETSRLIGQRWGGEPGWDADKWRTTDRHAALGAVLFYRISESLYTLSEEEMTARHGRRRKLLDAAVAGLIESGGQRLGSYFCEWSSEWHLYVLYEAKDIDSLAAFNRALPERHGYLDYDLVYLVGRRIAGPEAVVRP